MQQVIISSTQVEKYINLTAISGLSGSIVVTNNTASPVYVVVSSTESPEASTGILALSGEDVFVNNTSGQSVWIKSQNGGPVIVQSESEASTEVRCLESAATENTHTQATSLACKHLDSLSELINVM